jgi:hypothetical protein
MTWNSTTLSSFSQAVKTSLLKKFLHDKKVDIFVLQEILAGLVCDKKSGQPPSHAGTAFLIHSGVPRSRSIPYHHKLSNIPQFESNVVSIPATTKTILIASVYVRPNPRIAASSFFSALPPRKTLQT